MKALQLTLKVLAVGIFGVSLIHIVLGASSEPLLGSGISAASQLDPSLDSQNRFYGAAFALFGAVFWLCSTNLRAYRPFLTVALGIFFIAGTTRIVSMLFLGMPSTPIVLLSAIEIFGPPVMYIWMQRVLVGATTTD